MPLTFQPNRSGMMESLQEEAFWRPVDSPSVPSPRRARILWVLWVGEFAIPRIPHYKMRRDRKADLELGIWNPESCLVVAERPR
jgi:hypothetical protein